MSESFAETSLADLLPRAVALARDAGASIMTIYDAGHIIVQSKDDTSPLTQADLLSHRIIVDGLSRLSPNWPILSEEEAEIPYDRRRVWQRFWMVDPLDGTKEFLNRNGEFTVNIALLENDTPILGVVYAPTINQMYYAAKGLGAFKVAGETTSRLKVSEIVGLSAYSGRCGQAIPFDVGT